MTTLCLDIETIGGFPLRSEITDENAGQAVARAAAIAGMAKAVERDPEAFAALSPALARVVAVGMLQLENGRERCAFDAVPLRLEETPPEPSHVPFVGEARLLEHVNCLLSKVTRVVTFNGRCFDLAVLVHRSVALGVKPADFLLRAWREYRYKPFAHIDVRDLMTNFGAANGPGTSLRAFALGYGLKDPKAGGAGADVAQLVEKGDAAGLCEYCLGDVRATAQLYQRWGEACGLN
jgi:hypothetical protein